MCANVSAYGFGLLKTQCARYYGKCVSAEKYYSNNHGGLHVDGTSRFQIHKNRDHVWLTEKAWLMQGPDARLTVYS